MGKKQWPLDVYYLTDVDSHYVTAYYSKGHQDITAFCKEAKEEFDVIIDPIHVLYKYMRWSMITGPDGPCHAGEEYELPGRGRFAITISYQWEDVK
jgi:hypothetical protein